MLNTIRISAVALAVVALAACGGGSNGNGDAAARAGVRNAVEVEDAWVRASIPGKDTTAAYLTLRNTGDVDDELLAVSVSADVADRAEVHETVAAGEGGMGAPGGSKGDDGHSDDDHTTDDHTTGTTKGHDDDHTTGTTKGHDDDHTTGTTKGHDDDHTTGTTKGHDDDHTTGTTGGSAPVMTMRHVERIHLRRGKVVSLEPGGYHVMIFGVRKPLEVGDEVELRLRFRHAGTVTVTAEVRRG